MIGKIKRVPLREVWRHEAYDFTTWLVDNSDVLSTAIGVQLDNLEREHSAGSLSVDIKAEDPDGKVVIVENQLEKSDHDHLGKLITYTAMLEADVAVWIVAEPRSEHVDAVQWLNQTGQVRFFLLKVEAVRIENSPAAPLLTLIAGPSKIALEAGEVKKEYAARHYERQNFWTELLAQSKEQTRLFSNISPGHASYLSTATGWPSVYYVYRVTQRSAAVELYIDHGIKEENARIFEVFKAHGEEFEASFGEPLVWQATDGRSFKIKKEIPVGGYRTPENWKQLQSQMIGAMMRLDVAFKAVIEPLRFMR